MEINKQLFENVLSGKLKGTFVLRNGEKILSDALGFLKPFYRLYIDGRSYYYYNNGRYSLASETRADIIDFIQDINMKENELTIEIPDGKVAHVEHIGNKINVTFEDKKLVKIVKHYNDGSIEIEERT